MLSETSNCDYLALKDEGNALYSDGDFLGAVQKCTKGLKCFTDKNIDRSTLLENRGAAYLKLREYEKVVKDTTAALEITPSDIKALYHRCQAYEQLGKFNEAFEDARAFNHLNPENSTIQSYLSRLQEIIGESNDDALDINSLPDEMILKIFGYLEQNQLGQIARVCSRWNVLTRSPALWKKVDVKFHWSHKSHNTMSRYFINILPSCVTSIRLYCSNLDWTEKLDFEEFCVQLQRRCPRLEMLILEGFHLTNNFPSVIGLCTHFLPGLKVLVFHHSTFIHCPTREEFDGISKIEVLDVSDSNLRCPYEIQFSKMPQLRVLNLRNTGIVSRTFRQLPNHGLNLEELYLCGTSVRSEYLLFTNSMFPRLKILCLACHSSTRRGIPSVIQSCQALQKVYIREHFVITRIVCDPFFQLNICKFNIVEGVDEDDHSHNIEYCFKSNKI